MATKKLVIEIEFTEEEEDGYTFCEFSTMKIDEKATTVSGEELSGIAEGWAQSDWYWVGFTNSLISCLGGATITDEDVRENF